MSLSQNRASDAQAAHSATGTSNCRQPEKPIVAEHTVERDLDSIVDDIANRSHYLENAYRVLDAIEETIQFDFRFQVRDNRAVTFSVTADDFPGTITI